MAGDLLAEVRETGLIEAGRPLLVLLSGGADSVCLLSVASELGAELSALHVNYGLRGAESDGDEQHCRDLCDRLGVTLTVERVALDPDATGNLQSRARDVRYEHAERLAPGDYATGHTRSDEAETVLYRLASSPGSRALAGILPRRGRLIRPLLGQTREQTRDYCRGRSLPWRDDRANADSTFARTRVRHGLLPALTEISPGAEAALAETAAQVREEAALLELAVDDAITRLGGERIELAALALEPPGLARLVIRRLAERAVGRPCPVDRAGAARVLTLEGRPGTASVDLVAGARAVVEYGVLRLEDGSAEAPEQPAPQPLMIPGEARYGDWRISAELGGGGEAVLLASALGGEVTVRGWREGDRIAPAGLGGSKSLQDLFTDAKVPRSLRRGLPLVEVGGEIAWVAGLATAERFSARPGQPATVSLSARLITRD